MLKITRMIPGLIALALALVPGARGGVGPRAAPAQDDALRRFERGTRLYDEGDHRGAIDTWESLAREGRLAANLFYNLGNAHYRENDLGRAILNYTRAIAIEPRHPEARANLERASERSGAGRPAESRARALANAIGRPALDVACAVSFWGAAFGLALFLLSPRRPAWPLIGALASLIAFGALLALALACGDGLLDPRIAIVTAPETRARSEPTRAARELPYLRAGSRVLVHARRGRWLHVTMPDGARAWIDAGHVEPVIAPAPETRPAT